MATIAVARLSEPALNRKIPFISMIGKNTLPVYLLHGFIARLDKYGVVNFPNNILAYLLIAFGITLLLGNDFTAKWFNRIMPSGWFKKINR